MAETLTVTVRSVNGQHAELAVAGEVDVSSETVLRDALVRLVKDGATDLGVDLADVTFLDSSGLRSLIEVIQLGSTLTLRHLRPAVRLVFDIVTIPKLVIED
jgi:anti-anti-sigma factor